MSEMSKRLLLFLLLLLAEVTATKFEACPPKLKPDRTEFTETGYCDNPNNNSFEWNSKSNSKSTCHRRSNITTGKVFFLFYVFSLAKNVQITAQSEDSRSIEDAERRPNADRSFAVCLSCQKNFDTFRIYVFFSKKTKKMLEWIQWNNKQKWTRWICTRSCKSSE